MEECRHDRQQVRIKLEMVSRWTSLGVIISRLTVLNPICFNVRVKYVFAGVWGM